MSIETRTPPPSDLIGELSGSLRNPKRNGTFTAEELGSVVENLKLIPETWYVVMRDTAEHKLELIPEAALKKTDAVTIKVAVVRNESTEEDQLAWIQRIHIDKTFSFAVNNPPNVETLVALFEEQNMLLLIQPPIESERLEHEAVREPFKQIAADVQFVNSI